MLVIIVVENPKNWALDIPGTEVVAAREYLTSRRFVEIRRAKVFNLCRTYGYQTVGYYVSLLATARGHRPLPSVATVQELRQSALVRIVSEEIESRLQAALAQIKGDHFLLSIYFGRSLAKRYDRLSQTLFDHFPAPMLRAEFIRVDQWRLNSLRPIATNDIPDSHYPFVIEQAQRFFARPKQSRSARPRYDIGILHDPDEVDSPSNKKAIARFVRAAEKLGMRASLLRKQDYGRLGEYDALFIRETTYVNHHTYRFAQRAQAEGLVVIDDPESIIRCTNKVYQAEIFEKKNIACPKTLIVHRDNTSEVSSALGFPVVLKRPDSSFSAGVKKADDEAELQQFLQDFFAKSDLIVAQEFMRSDFDWRVGVLDGRPLYACKYYMAKGHWQIQKVDENEKRSYGRTETMAVGDAPVGAIELGVRAANLIGSGLYGVDIKDVNGRFMVMEINDNPSVDAGYEDAVIKDELYMSIMRYFYDRLEFHGVPSGSKR